VELFFSGVVNAQVKFHLHNNDASKVLCTFFHFLLFGTIQHQSFHIHIGLMIVLGMLLLIFGLLVKCSFQINF
jgi:hypothetical protein